MRRRHISRKQYNRLLRLRFRLALGTFLGRGRKAKKDFTSRLPDDILFAILKRLDAKNFASAARVDKRWNRLCNGVFSRPKIISVSGYAGDYLSMDKVLSEPFRPQFVVLATKLGSIPLEHMEVITHVGPNTPVLTNDCMAVFQEEELDDFDQKMQFQMIASLPELMVDVIGLFKKKNTISLQKFVADIRSFSVAPLLIILCVNGTFDLARNNRDVISMAREIRKEFLGTHFICGATMPMQVDFQSRGDYEFHFQKERTGSYKKSSSSRVSYSQKKYEHGAALVFANNGDLVAGIEIARGNGFVTQEGLVFVLTGGGSVVRVKMNMRDGSQHVMMVGKMAYAWETPDEFFLDAEDD